MKRNYSHLLKALFRFEALDGLKKHFQLSCNYVGFVKYHSDSKICCPFLSSAGKKIMTMEFPPVPPFHHPV